MVVVVVWLFRWKHKARGGGLGHKLETGPLGPGLGCTVGSSNGG